MSRAFATSFTGGCQIEPLLVRPRTAWRLLGCGNTRGYELLAAGELESFLDGRSRKITVDSIRRYIARRLDATTAAPGEPYRSRRRGRPRKSPALARQSSSQWTHDARPKPPKEHANPQKGVNNSTEGVT